MSDVLDRAEARAPQLAPAPQPLAEHPAVTRQRLRAAATTLIHKLIRVVDAIDGDADFEPSLSAAVPQMTWEGSQDAWLQGADDDREDACDDEGSEADREASLCGVFFGTGDAMDREPDHSPVAPSNPLGRAF